MALSSSPAALAVWAALAYAAWLRFGSRANPPTAYEDFNTGLTFAAVRELLGFEQQAAYDAGQYMFVSRGTVLGRMHQLKQEQYARYLDHYEEADEDMPF